MLVNVVFQLEVHMMSVWQDGNVIAYVHSKLKYGLTSTLFNVVFQLIVRCYPCGKMVMHCLSSLETKNDIDINAFQRRISYFS